MILIDNDTPRWIRELDRFVHLKSLILLHGNVLDLVAYPVADGARRYWTESGLEPFFHRYLGGLGYQVVGGFDPLEGLRFAEPDMGKRFDALGGEAGGGSRPPRRPAPPGGLVDADPVVERMARVLANREVPAAFVLYFASRLLSTPDRLARSEQALFTRLLKASLDSREVVRQEGRWSNVLILVCDKINDLPAFLYLNNPRSRSIQVDRPSASERGRFIRASFPSFHRARPENGAPSGDLIARFAALTDGFTHYELLSLVGLSLREGIPVEEVETLCERFKYGITESEWERLDHSRLARAGELIRGRIKGQEAAVQRLLEMVKRAKLGLAAGGGRHVQRPRGVLFFAGPTGVGKTEMAKALAVLLFGDEDRLVRFDMSEYAVAHADQKLLGAPPGYVGYEEGGRLTNAIKAQPFSVLLFDEIEKAHPSIFDKFLQVLDDGRLTDSKGETAYFSECVIIFTSNLGTVGTDAGGEARLLVSPEMPFDRVRDTILAAVRRHFDLELGRPEVLNRFGDNFVVFDFIRPPADEQILDHLLDGLCTGLGEQQGIRLHLPEAVRTQLLALGRDHLHHGGRGIRNALESALLNPLAAALFDQGVVPGAAVEVTRLEDRGPAAARRFGVEIRVLPRAGDD